jgi:HAE1 family hydrophobic/amphiphilic exporter-1
MLKNFALIFLSSLPLLAQDLTLTPRVGVGLTQKKLTLAEAIEMALENNFDIEIEKTNVSTAAAAIRFAQGAFDPNFRFLPGYTTGDTPVGSVLQGANGRLTQDTLEQDFHYRQQLPWNGALAQVDFINGRFDSNNPFASFNPYINTQLVVSFTQPLWRNRAIDQFRAAVLVRRKQKDVSEKDFELRVIDILTQVQQAYWDLVAARQDVSVQADAVGLAAKQLAQNERMIDSGTLAPIERSASVSELESRKDTYFSSVGTLTAAENNLKMLLLPDRRHEIWGDEIIPTDANSLDVPQTDDVREAVGEALRRRPELKQIALRKESNQIDQRLNADQRKPQVNLVASYTSAGLSGTPNNLPNPLTASTQPIVDRINLLSAEAGLSPFTLGTSSVPAGLIGGYGNVLSSVFSGNYMTVQAGIALDFTARNRSAQANYSTTLIAAKRLDYEQGRAEQLIEVQVRNALQSIQTARQRIIATEAAERAAKEKLDSETRLFRTGESTNFLVLTRQDEYLDARRRAVVAHLDLNRSVAQLEQALGTTLSRHNVTLQLP